MASLKRPWGTSFQRGWVSLALAKYALTHTKAIVAYGKLKEALGHVIPEEVGWDISAKSLTCTTLQHFQQAVPHSHHSTSMSISAKHSLTPLHQRQKFTIENINP
jgi:hypothetical protein